MHFYRQLSHYLWTTIPAVGGGVRARVHSELTPISEVFGVHLVAWGEIGWVTRKCKNELL